MSDRKVVIWGCGGHAREVNYLCKRAGVTVKGFLDERPQMKGKLVDGIPVLGDIDDIVALKDKVKIVCAGVGDPELKARFYNKTIESEFEIAEAIVHPRVEIDPDNNIGKGVIICEGATMTIGIELSDHVVINRNVTIGHDCIVEAFSTISPGTNISGNVTIREKCFIGTGSSIREKVTIAAHTTVGGGAFVDTDIVKKGTYVGVPARLMSR